MFLLYQRQRMDEWRDRKAFSNSIFILVAPAIPLHLVYFYMHYRCLPDAIL